MKNRQRGFGWGEVIVVLVAIGMLAGIVMGVNHWWNGKMAEATEAGRNEIRNKELKERNDRLVEAQKTIKKLEGEREAKEAEHAATVAAVDAKGQQGVKDAQAKAARDVAAIRAGTLLMRDTGLRPRFGCPDSGGGKAATSGLSAGVGDGAAAAELQRQADAAFLRGEAGRADQVVEQLTACQAIVVADRKACNP